MQLVLFELSLRKTVLKGYVDYLEAWGLEKLEFRIQSLVVQYIFIGVYLDSTLIIHGLYF